MNKFIKELSNNDYSAILFLDDVTKLLNLKIFENDFKKLGNNHKILIDTLLCRGNSKDRFIEIEFNDGTLNLSSLKFIHINKGNNIRKICANHINYFKLYEKTNILTSVQIKMICKNIAI